MPNFRLGTATNSDKWYVYWTEGGKTRRISTRTKCQQAAKQFLADLEAGFNEPPTSITINIILDEYLKYKERDYTLNKLPIKRYKGILEKTLITIRSEFGYMRPDQITQDLGRKYIDKCLEAKKKTSTIRRRLTLLNAAVNYVKREGWDIKYIPIKLPAEPPPKDIWLKPEQVKAFLDSITTQHIKLFAYLGFYTLARKGAILDLTWDRVDLQNGLIDFNNPNRGRTHKRRPTVPIAKELRKQLEAALEVATTNNVIEYNGKEIINIKKAFKKAVKNFNKQIIAADPEQKELPITPHILRHTGATLMMQRGMDVFNLAGIMRVSVKTASETYAKHHPDFLKKGIEMLENLYG